MSVNNALRFEGVGNVLDREYRNSPAFQWARELVRNGIEANASRIETGIEWQVLASRGVYRFQYADDGDGMGRNDLRTYMRTLGKGSKVVGGPHDNYAIGCRMTLLPWNPAGVVVISVVDGEANMVKMMFDPESGDGPGEYVLEELDWEDEHGEVHRSTVYPPYFDDQDQVDWKAVVPEMIRDAGHGTTFVLLGRTGSDDTFDGDTERGETARELTRKYFNTRFWSLPEGTTLSYVDVLNPFKRDQWPKDRADRDRYQRRSVKGAKDVVEYTRRDKSSTIVDNGIVALHDGTKAQWWLREEDVDTGGIGASSGFLAVLYRGELYGHAYANSDDGDTRLGASVYRQFGIVNDAVRKRVFIVLEPPEYDEDLDRPGVAPSTGRADLYWIGAGLSPRSIKPGDWADEFADKMPKAIQDALDAAHGADRAEDEDRQNRLKRVMDKLNARWRTPRAKPVDGDGETTTKPSTVGQDTRQPPDVPTTEKRRKPARRKVTLRKPSGDPQTGPTNVPGPPAKTTTITLGYPKCQWVAAEDINEDGMIAAWVPRSTQYPAGLILLDKTHPVITGQIHYWQSQYPRAVSQQIEDIVKDAYEDVATAKVSHIHALTGPVISEEQQAQMLSNPALTASMVGLLGEDALITPRLGGLGTKRKKESDRDEAPAEAPEVTTTG